jgi:hypothetical protein
MQARDKPRKLSHPRSSTVEPFTWRRWSYQFLETPTGEQSPWTKELREGFFRKHHKEAAKFWGLFGEKYDVRAAYERGLRRHDPLLAPHGLFRSLAYKNNAHAREFLEKFGPPLLPPRTSIYSPEVRVRRESSRDVLFIQNQLEIDLRQFWSLHRRFCLVVRLWEAKSNREALIAAWRDVERYREEASIFDVLGLGEEYGGRTDPPHTYYEMLWPWDFARKNVEDWLSEAPTSVLSNEALRLVGSELTLHIRGAEIYWDRGWESTGTKFRQIVVADNLWSVMWEFFGWDTAGESWRQCPHCRRFFYPKRRDQFYCTSRQQALASKREYARRRRTEERHKFAKRTRLGRKKPKGATQ